MTTTAPFYVTFAQVEESFISLETRFAQLVFSFDNPLTKNFFPLFVNNAYGELVAINYALSANKFGISFAPQLLIMKEAVEAILAYADKFWNVRPNISLTS